MENANDITLWLFNLLLELVTLKLAVLAENPRNSIMWLTPEAKRLKAADGMMYTDYDACAYACTRKQKQTLLHNIAECHKLAAACHHTHAKDEWKPIKKTGKTEFPTAEETTRRQTPRLVFCKHL